MWVFLFEGPRVFCFEGMGSVCDFPRVEEEWPGVRVCVINCRGCEMRTGGLGVSIFGVKTVGGRRVKIPGVFVGFQVGFRGEAVGLRRLLQVVLGWWPKVQGFGG